MLQTQEPLAYDYFGPSDFGLNKLGKEQVGNATYLISSIWGKWFWKRFLNISHLFLWFEHRTLGQGHFVPKDHHLNKSGRISLYNANIKFQTSEHRGPSWILRSSFEHTSNWKRTNRQCYIPNFKHLSKVVLKKKIFEYFSMYSYGLNLGLPGQGPSWILGTLFEQTS